jgi:Rrf2 family transcriptional regulator, cysteine metabolism repressor
MMFSTKAEYGVRVMVALARRAAEAQQGASEANGSEPVVSLAEIAEGDGLPLAYLEHLVARLRKAGLIDSRRGSRGGYLLGRPAEQITMAEVVEALEGSIAPIECISEAPDGSVVCSRESGRAGPDHVCPTKLLWTRVRFSIVRTLANTTLADLLLQSALAPVEAQPTSGAQNGSLSTESTLGTPGGTLPSPLPTTSEKTTTPAATAA